MLGVVIVAAGSGIRMRGQEKVFAPLAGYPVIAHAVRPFQESALVSRIVVVLSAENLQRGEKLMREQGFDKVTAVRPGGARRQDSVLSGLDALEDCSWVAVHDSARPFVTQDMISKGLQTAEVIGAAVPAVPVADTIKEVSGEGLVVRTLDRRPLRSVQTPQFFRADLLRRAHREVAFDVTDDAAMLEALGAPVALYPGSPANFKITTPEDLDLAEALMKAARSRLPGR